MSRQKINETKGLEISAIKIYMKGKGNNELRYQ